MKDPASMESELDDLLGAAGRLPVCDGSAKLHALVDRVLEAARTGGSVAPACEALARAATAALADDPWVQFEAAVRRVQGCASGSATAADVLRPPLQSMVSR